MILVKKIAYMSMCGILLWSSSVTAFASPLMRMACLTGAAYMAYDSYDGYKKANTGISTVFTKQCDPIIREDFKWENLPQLQAKGSCYIEKYEKVIPKALVVAVLVTATLAL